MTTPSAVTRTSVTNPASHGNDSAEPVIRNARLSKGSPALTQLSYGRPASAVPHCRTGARPPVAVWTTAQTRRFLKAAAGHRLFAAYHLIALQGLRRGEACGLRWADLDLDAGLAYITRQVQHVAGKLTACH